MTTLAKFPTSNVAASGFNGSWTNPNNAHADDGVYATVTNLGRNKEFASYWFGFDFSTIADGSTINSVTVDLQWKASTTGSIATLRSTAFSDHDGAGNASTAIGNSPGVTDTAEPTTDTVRSYTIPATVAQLKASGFAIRVQALQGNTNTSFTGSLDYVRVTVDYTAPATITGSGGITSPASSLNASAALAFSASGGITSAASSIAGTSTEVFAASGGITSQASSLDAAGDVGSAPVSASGGIASPSSSLSATGVLTFTASGGLTSPASSVDGSAVLAFTGSGGVESPASSLDATAILAFTGNGGVASSASSLVGSVALVFEAQGDITSAASSLDAAATLTFSASGGIASPASSITGSSGTVENITASGGVEGPASAIAAEAVLAFDSSGNLVTLASVLAASGTLEFAGDGAVESPASSLSASASVSSQGGNITSPASSIAGEASNTPPEVPQVSSVLVRLPRVSLRRIDTPPLMAFRQAPLSRIRSRKHRNRLG